MARITIEYENKKVEKLFENNCEELVKTWDRQMARRVKSHMGNLRAVTSFYEFVRLGIGKPHTVFNILPKCYGVSVSANVRLILEPICDNMDTESLKQCCVVRVKGVCDYHDGKTNWYVP